MDSCNMYDLSLEIDASEIVVGESSWESEIFCQEAGALDGIGQSSPWSTDHIVHGTFGHKILLLFSYKKPVTFVKQK